MAVDTISREGRRRGAVKGSEDKKKVIGKEQGRGINWALTTPW